MRYRPIFLFFLVAGFFSGCPSHTLLSVQDQQKIQSQQKNKTYYLKQSFFAVLVFFEPAWCEQLVE